MTLTSALKVKNRLIGQLNKVRSDIHEHNSTCKDREIDIQALWQEEIDTRNKLIELKSKISKETAKIADKLVSLAEHKSYLQFLNGLSCRTGEDISIICYSSSATKTENWSSYISETKRRQLIKETEEQIAWLQDCIDEFNATTVID
jgi:hypothetical protein